MVTGSILCKLMVFQVALSRKELQAHHFWLMRQNAAHILNKWFTSSYPRVLVSTVVWKLDTLSSTPVFLILSHTHNHLTLHQSVEGVYWWQVGCYGNVLIPPWCLNVHSNSPWRHVAVEIGHYAGGEGHISQTTLAVIATRTGCREEEWRHISCHYFNLHTNNWMCYI